MASSETSSPSHKRPTPPENPRKRRKIDPLQDEARLLKRSNLLMHPSRMSLLRKPDDIKDERDSSPIEAGKPTLTGSNMEPLSSQVNEKVIPTGPKATRSNSNLIRRQWDQGMDNVDYKELLEQRRQEKVYRVDRYVPEYDSRKYPVRPVNASFPAVPKPFPLNKLPNKIKKKIFELLLVAPNPVTIDFYWLRPFLNGHARIPSVAHNIEHDSTTYSMPVSWSKLLSDIDLMQSDMAQFHEALEVHGTKARRARSPCRGLTLGLLQVSRNFHKIAASVLYGQNTFNFPCATSAWIQLDSFLTTIGAKNVASLQHLCVDAPLWHRGIQRDFLEGALIDSLSPASRMAVLKPPPHDRLLSAIQHLVEVLQDSNLTTLTINLENGLTADYWCGRWINDRKLISLAEAEEFVERKKHGAGLLKQLSDVLASKHKAPVIRLSRANKGAPHDMEELRMRLKRVQLEAQKYGWRVDTRLRD